MRRERGLKRNRTRERRRAEVERLRWASSWRRTASTSLRLRMSHRPTERKTAERRWRKEKATGLALSIRKRLGGRMDKRTEDERTKRTSQPEDIFLWVRRKRRGRRKEPERKERRRVGGRERRTRGSRLVGLEHKEMHNRPQVVWVVSRTAGKKREARWA